MDDLKTILTDFCNDIKNTFPEKKEDVEKIVLDDLTIYCKEYFTNKTLEIVYKNEKIFSESCYFLPNIDFKELWNSNISAFTKDTIWKYLQLILFSYVSLDEYSFDETVKFFEKLDKDDFKDKIEEIMKKLKEDNNFDKTIIPDENKLNSTFENLFNTKIGNIASEIAEETSKHMNLESEKDVMLELLNNPAKLMSMVKSVGDSLDKKIKSGDISQEELLKESTNLLGNLNMNAQMQNLFSNLGMGDLEKMANIVSNKKNNTNGVGVHGKKQKYDTNKIKQNISKMSTKERLQNKLEKKNRKQDTTQ